LKNWIVFILLLARFAPVYAADLKASPWNAHQNKTQRVGGDYKVTKIERDGAGVFHIEFHSTQSSGRFDILKLESDHVHVAVKVGQVLRLSAEIMEERGSEAHVSQVVLFLNGQSGRVPVWLLSRKAMGRDLKAVRYLEMHVPANDFVVM
jgi:hypothetical protein